MSGFKISKNGNQGISPQMALLHLRWQQMRCELLNELQQQTSTSSNPQDHTQSAPVGTRKKVYTSA